MCSEFAIAASSVGSSTAAVHPFFLCLVSVSTTSLQRSLACLSLHVVIGE